MPYNSDKDEFYWSKRMENGNIVNGAISHDGSDYSPSLPRPKLSDIYRYLSRHFSGGTLFHVVIVGKIYKQRTQYGGITASAIDLDSIEGVIHDWLGRSLEYKLMKLLGLYEQPEHITGIYLRPLT